MTNTTDTKPICPLLTQERLKEVVNYNPESGIFTWLVHHNSRVPLGSTAGCLGKVWGYRLIRVDGKLYRASRLAHLWMTGRWPDIMDHINHKRDDDRWANLRECSQAQNLANVLRPVGKTGYTGVRQQGKNSYIAEITHEGTTVTTASFDNPSEAAAAYCFMAQMLCGEFAKY